MWGSRTLPDVAYEGAIPSCLKLLIGGFHSISIKAFCIMQDAFILFKLFSDCLFADVI